MADGQDWFLATFARLYPPAWPTAVVQSSQTTPIRLDFDFECDLDPRKVYQARGQRKPTSVGFDFDFDFERDLLDFDLDQEKTAWRTAMARRRQTRPIQQSFDFECVLDLDLDPRKVYQAHGGQQRPTSEDSDFEYDLALALDQEKA